MLLPPSFPVLLTSVKVGIYGVDIQDLSLSIYIYMCVCVRVCFCVIYKMWWVGNLIMPKKERLSSSNMWGRYIGLVVVIVVGMMAAVE